MSSIHPGPSIVFSPIAQTFHPHLHFTLNLTFPYPFSLYSASSSPPSSSSYDDTDAKHNDKHRGGTVPRCNLQLNLHLPDSIFLDPSELPDHFAAQPNILSWKIEPGEVDIERPEIYARSSDTGEGGRAEAEEGVKRAGEREGEGAGAGSEFWLMLTKSDSETSNGQVEVKIPVHGRYLTPDESGYRRITLFESGIRGGWVCTPGLDSSPSTTCSSSPSDNSPFWIPIDSLPTLTSSPSTLTLTLPTGHPSHQLPVEVITAGSIWLGFFYLTWKIWRLVRRVDGGRLKRE